MLLENDILHRQSMPDGTFNEAIYAMKRQETAIPNGLRKWVTEKNLPRTGLPNLGKVHLAHPMQKRNYRLLTWEPVFLRYRRT